MVKVASGGELARFLLALKVSLADKGSAPTLIFDEIDTGVGGAVAEAIGVRLSRLAERVQVVTVTHAPQVAARASNHLQVAKEAKGADHVATRLVPLDEGARHEEIARMLSGHKVTDEARAAAKRLIAHHEHQCHRGILDRATAPVDAGARLGILAIGLKSRRRHPSPAPNGYDGGPHGRADHCRARTDRGRAQGGRNLFLLPLRALQDTAVL